MSGNVCTVQMAFPDIGQHADPVMSSWEGVGWAGRSEKQEHGDCHRGAGSGLGDGAEWEEVPREAGAESVRRHTEL